MMSSTSVSWLGVLLVACSSSRAPDGTLAPRPAASTSPADATTGSPPMASASSASSAPTSPFSSPTQSSNDVGEPKLCGCSLCEPVVSEDPCTRDDECAPATACHAERCVAKAKAAPRPSGQMCTMMMACHSADANKCGCFKGRCALTPRERT